MSGHVDRSVALSAIVLTLGVAGLVWWGTSATHSGQSLAALRSWVERGPSVVHRIFPVPKVTPYHPVPFSAIRDPFHSFIRTVPKATQVGPAAVRPDAPPLQRYPLAALTLTGFIGSAGQPYRAVIETPHGGVHIAGVGQGIGTHADRIVKIVPSTLLHRGYILVRRPVVLVLGHYRYRTVRIRAR